MKYILAIILLTSFLACNNVATKEHQLLDFRKDIQELKTKNQRDTFLSNLYVRDQAIRISNEEERLISQYGYNSNEHKEFWARVNKIDLKNYHQLKLYLEIHGYTKETSSFSSNARSSFGVIMAHYHEYDDQLKILELLIPAYKKEFVSIDTVVWIMSEMHEAKYHKLFDVGKERYTVEDEFEGLVNKLQLTKLFNE